MRLKLMEAIEAKQTGRRLTKPMRCADFKYEARPSPHRVAECDFEFRTGVELYVIGRGQKDASRDLQEQARRRIAKEVYGDVADEVFAILEAMWDEGLSVKSPAIRRAERLLHLLNGRAAPDTFMEDDG